MSIDVIFTGGTIGSRVDQRGYLSTEKGQNYVVLEQFKGRCSDQLQQIPGVFRIHEPYQILSENLSWKELNILIQTVQTVLAQPDTEGIIITHGTDTLAYTAAVLSYAFPAAAVPILLVSSNYGLHDARANGLANFNGAYQWISQRKKPGVYVSYTNPGDSTRIHYGTRINKSLGCTDAIYSILDTWLARVNGSDIEENPSCLCTGETGNVPWTAPVMADCGRQILPVYPNPFMSYPEIGAEVQVILLDSYHSGTLAVNEKLQEFCKKAQERNIPIFLIGLDQRETAYETVAAYDALGIFPVETSAWIAQYMKAAVALSNGADIRTIMQIPIAQDLIPRG